MNGKEIPICTNPTPATEVLATTDDGAPLLCRYAVGEGEILLFNTPVYPANSAICSLYESEMQRVIRKATDAEPVWATTGDDVEFAVYRQEDGSAHVYFLAVDWYRPEEPLRHATLRLGKRTYDVALPFGVLVKCVTDGDSAAWPTAEEGEVLCREQDGWKVQGRGKVDFCIAENGDLRRVTVDFSENPIAFIQ